MQSTTGGNWSASGNWAGGTVADGSGFTANFNTLDITADNTIHLDSARTIGNLTFGDTNTATAAGWILDNNGSAGNILTLAGAAPTITVNTLAPVDVYAPKSTVLSGVIAGSNGLTKAGAGRLKLTAANTYTGGTVVNGGTLAIINDNNLGAVPGSFDADNITLNNGAILDLTATTDVYNAGNTVTLHANRGILLGAGMQTIRKNHRGVQLHIHGVISGDGGVIFDEPTTGDDGGGSRTYLYGANTYTGDTRIAHAGNRDPGLVLRNSLALQNSTLDFRTTDSPANPQGTNGNMLWFDGTIGAASGFTLGGLKGDKNIDLSAQNGFNAGNLRIGNNNQDTLYSGIIRSSTQPTARITKIGTGTLTLTGASTYAGGTTVENGTLLINNTTGSGTGSGAVTVNGGLLGGTGNISGAITVNAGGAVAPGASIGTLHGTSLTWNSDDLLAGMVFELSSIDDTSDLLDLSGAFTKGTGNTFLFDFIGGTPGTTYTLVEFGSTNFLASDFGIASGTNGTFAIVGNTLQFNALASVSAVPEAATLMIWSIVGLLGIGYCWHKSR